MPHKFSPLLPSLCLSIFLLSLLGLTACDAEHADHVEHTAEHAHHAPTVAEFERGPHRGRLLREGDLAIEITIFEDGVPPQFHLYAYEKDQPLNPSDVQVTIELSRLDGEVNRFEFTPKDDFLDGGATVVEPHSFDVKVQAVYKGQTHTWQFSSYEGRTTITEQAAQAAGLQTEIVGPAIIDEKMALSGRIVPNANQVAQIRGRFPGIVREVHKNLGDAVAAGDVLAVIESNDSLQTYSVKAPIKGVVLTRNTNVGDVAGDTVLFTIGNLDTLWAEFHVFPKDISQVKLGQKLTIQDTAGTMTTPSSVSMIAPLTQSHSQTVLIRAVIDNQSGQWRSGMLVQGDLVVSQRQVALAVKASALQRFRDFTVVFAQVGQTYEVRMLEMGMNDGNWVEILEGIKPDTRYVTDNSFLIKSDIEKSGASHDH
jgi:cobalt-zinc-cadmium efflux system membrane fusion protein